MTLTLTPELIAFATLIFSGVVWLVTLTARFARIEVKVDTMWGFQLKRGEIEAIKKGVATRNSPLKVSEAAKQCAQPLLPLMRSFYETTGRHMPLPELYLELIRRFDAEIVKEICIPLDISESACLLIIGQALQDAFPIPA